MKYEKRAATWIQVVGLAIVMTPLLMGTVSYGFSGAGAGTTANPYQITDVSQLQEIQNALSATYVLVNDIDASATRTWNGGAGFAPIGTTSTSFRGEFNGQGHVISELYINRPSQDQVGLFGYAYTGPGGPTPLIHDVGLIEADITGHDGVGALSGGMNNWATYGTSVYRAFSTGIVQGHNTVGGLVASLYDTKMADCYSWADVTGNQYTGGLIGSFGFSEVSRCYATGNVVGAAFTGGLVGGAGGTSGKPVVMRDSFATGRVQSSTGSIAPTTDGFGGLMGAALAGGGTPPGPAAYAVTNNYYDHTADNPSVGVGNYAHFISWDTTDVGQPTTLTGWTRKDNNQAWFYSSSNGPMTSWDFTNVWGIDQGSSYPYLKWQGGPLPVNVVSDLGGPYIMASGQGITLDGSASYDPDLGDSIAQWAWDLNRDGVHDVFGQVVSLSWSNLLSYGINSLGSYCITLKVTDNHGNTDLSLTMLTVQEAPPVPEPATLALLGLGILGLAGLRRK